MIDIILQDFCEVVGMYDDTTSPHSRAYFRKTLPDGGEDLVETGTCSKEEIDLPWVSQATECIYINPPTESPTSLPTQSPTESPIENSTSVLSSITAILSFIMVYMMM